MLYLIYILGEQGVASFAAVTPDEPVSSAVDHVPFKYIYPNLGNHWNDSSQSFSAPFTSQYFVSLSAGARTGSEVDYVLQANNEPFVNIRRASTSHNDPDMSGRDIIVSLNQFQTLHVASRGSAGLYSDNGLQSSISVFDLGDVMFDVEAFSVGRNQLLIGHAEPFPFNLELVNVGNNYNMLTNNFQAPFDGEYWLSFSTGVYQGEPAEMTLHINGAPYVHLIYNSTTHNGTDTVGRSILVELDQGDLVHLVNGDRKTSVSDALLQTSFSGFEYFPEHANEESIPMLNTESSLLVYRL